MSRLFHRLSKLPVYGWTPTELAERVFTWLAYESRANWELSCSCMEMVQDCSGEGLEEDSAVIANELYAFATSLLAVLRHAQAYHDGYLRYQFRGWLGYDIVLGRFVLDVDPNA